jgi:hypothetical protein
LAVSFDGRAVVVAVQDGSMLEPHLRPFDLAAARGRGLQMVDALAKSWHWVQHAGGKTVQAVIITRLVVCRMVLAACVG